MPERSGSTRSVGHAQTAARLIGCGASRRVAREVQRGSGMDDAMQEEAHPLDIPDAPTCECWAPSCVCDQLRDEDRDDRNDGVDDDLGLDPEDEDEWHE